jgi:hypothetical protein
MFHTDPWPREPQVPGADNVDAITYWPWGTRCRTLPTSWRGLSLPTSDNSSQVTIRRCKTGISRSFDTMCTS